MKKVIIFALLFLFATTCLAEDTKILLEKANQLKHQAKYEEAEGLYLQVLEYDPYNPEALHGREHCRIMIEPLIPTQHLALPPEFDEEHHALIQQLEEAEAPWDRRRIQMELFRMQERHTGDVFAEDEAEWTMFADETLSQGFERLKQGDSPQQVYLETEKELVDLQRQANRAWKGHGPKVLKPALEKLDKFYKDHNYKNPALPLILSVEINKESSEEGKDADLIASITNTSSFPVVLLDMYLEEQGHKIFAWQRTMRGTLHYNETKDEYLYHRQDQQESPPLFNTGLLFPNQTLTFIKRNRIPKQKTSAQVGFVLLDDPESMVYIQKSSDGANVTYKPVKVVDIAYLATVKSFFVKEGPSPAHGTVIFDDRDEAIRMQSFLFDLATK